MKSSIKTIASGTTDRIQIQSSSSATPEEQIVIGHTRNSMKRHFFQGSRD